MFKGRIFEDSKTYDILKFLASPCLPAVSFLLITVAGIFTTNGFEKIGFWLNIAGGIVAAIATCLGDIVRQSSKVYWANQNGDSTPIKED